MTDLVELSNSKHKHLNLKSNCGIEFAATQHIIKIRVPEVAKSATNFPIFFSRDHQNGLWVLSVLTHFDSGYNLFIDKQQWLSTYQPSSTKTYPFYLMPSAKQENSYTIGILEDSHAFSDQQGEPLFEHDGKASSNLNRAKTLLEDDIKNDIITHQFSQKLEELNLLKAIDLQIQYHDGSLHTLAGLHTIDEDVLHQLPTQAMEELNKQGFLIPVHAMLISLYQLNMLLRKHNDLSNLKKVKQLKIEVAKDMTAA
jgi:hypothetical protein